MAVKQIRPSWYTPEELQQMQRRIRYLGWRRRALYHLATIAQLLAALGMSALFAYTLYAAFIHG